MEQHPQWLHTSVSSRVDQEARPGAMPRPLLLVDAKLRLFLFLTLVLVKKIILVKKTTMSSSICRNAELHVTVLVIGQRQISATKRKIL